MFFLTVHGNRMRGNTQKLKAGKCWFDTKEKKNDCEGGKTLERVAQRGGAKSASSELFKTQQDTTLSNLIWLDLF